MAKYGYDFYGVGHYGAISLIDFDARPFTAVGNDYGSIFLSWVTPSGAWDQMRVTRDSNGYSPRSDMGLVLIDQPSSAAVTSFVDTQNLTPGSFYYYTVWVRATSDGSWRRAADTTGLAVQNWGSSDRLYSLIPMVYRDMDVDTTAAKVYGSGPLKRFLQIIGFQADHIRAELETLKHVNDPDNVAGGLLPLMSDQWGFGFEQELGMRLSRIQNRNAVHMYRYKGTRLGVEAFVSAMTGWAPTVGQGVNIMLDQDDSSFVNSLGRWVPALNCTLALKDVSVAPTFGVAIPAPVGASTGNVGSGNNVMRMTSVAAGDMRAHVGLTAADVMPVTAGTAYTFSGYTYAGSVARNAQVWVRWYDSTLTQIGATLTSASVLNSLAAWTRVTLANSVAPAGAVWAGVSAAILTTAGAGEIHYWDAFQMEAGAVATAWQSARDVRILLKADRVNYITNPGFEVNTVGWAAGTGAPTLARTTAQFDTGTASMSITATATGTSGASTATGTSAMPVPAGSWFSVRGRMRAAATSHTVRVDIVWVNGAGAVISTSAGATTTDLTTGWVDVSNSAVAPVNTVYAYVVFYVTNASAIGEVHYLDSVIAEHAQTNGTYFDGTTFSAEGEYVWEGTAMASRTHYYSRRLIKNFRLNQRLLEFLPAGATYTLVYADPSTV